MLDISQQKEQFSFAYIRAVATVAGFSVTEPSVDDDSIDLTLASRAKNGTTKSPRLEIQVKCTDAHPVSATGVHYPLPIKNYEDLRGDGFASPRLLVVVVVPGTVNQWVTQTQQQLAMKHCGYWLSLRNLAPSANKNSVTMVLPSQQVFSVQALQQIMSQIAAGAAP